ncbi:hypothetical protein HUG15_08605 [Salicibibacter cibarius]|uniref:Uncharacterized protein n=1 Tax=Salicibibacter cibarius TaxID=2743000 RepID=A0A7T7CB88_9BACI|nr:hypothetical protein [Salicibibacter cibarius]QQK75618.1 hypothetical protein HUG15_08605 [Salicibibacter cibarius]
MMLEFVTDMNWIYVMMMVSSLAVIGFHSHLRYVSPMQLMTRQLQQSREKHVNVFLAQAPVLAAPRVQQKIPAFNDRSHDDDDEASYPPLY